MKKTIIMTLALMAFASSVFATTTAQFFTNANMSSIATGFSGFNPSNNVTVGYVSDQAAGQGTMYGIGAKHSTGDTIFGSTSGSTAIWKKASTSPYTISGAADIPTVPASVSDSTVQSGWSSM